MIPGLGKTIKKKIQELHKSNTNIKVVTHRNRNILSWIGGSIFTCLPTFNKMWITKDNYNEYGYNAFYRK